MSDKIPLLVFNPLEPEHQAELAQRFELHYAPSRESREAALAAHGERIRALLTIGVIKFDEAQLARLPALELVCCMGVGYEGLPLQALRTRGIAIANGAGTNDECVADHAFGLLIGIVRGLRMLDRQCREGVWRDALPHPPNVSGKKLGILGLGGIGEKIARRAEAFNMPVAYHNRKPRSDVAHRYVESPLELARWSDILLCVLPGGAATHHLIDTPMLDTLGPRGWLVNVGRGSVVDTAALAAALRDRRIAGAALDVYESEPRPPAELIGLDNLIITPHVAGRSPEATQAGFDRFLANADGFFAGRGLVSPV